MKGGREGGRVDREGERRREERKINGFYIIMKNSFKVLKGNYVRNFEDFEIVILCNSFFVLWKIFLF